MDPGQRAPAFELHDQTGQRVALSSFLGRTLVLYFYPEADTPGCTKQACAIRDRRADVASHDAVIVGISPDPPEKLLEFADRYGLPFTLLSDPGGRVARRYGVWRRRRRPPFRAGNERTTFVIGPDGVVLQVFRAVDPELHDELVLGALAAAP